MLKKKCRICKKRTLKKVFSLGEQPLANNFLKERDEREKTYPLDLYECSHCGLLQLGHVVPKEKLYDEYTYIPSASKEYLKHFRKLSQKLIGQLKLKKDSLVVDIGGSDGSFAECFKNRGMRVVNVEPAKNIVVKKGIPFRRGYFDNQLARDIVVDKGKAKLVTATNSFAHIDDLYAYLEALDTLLDEDGVFFAQFPDARNLLRENQFDTIYHEHLSYFTYEPLHHLFANSKFELFNITSDNIHGGSMQIWVRRRPPLLKKFEKSLTLNFLSTRLYLEEAKAQGKKIAGFGAAAKGTVLLNYYNLEFIDYVVDSTPYKQGKFVPGVRVPVYPEEHLLKDPPDIVIILAWNFKNEIMEKLKGRGYIFVIPIPKLQICE